MLCVDRDGKVGTKTVLNNIEQEAQMVLSGNRTFLAENAWQELEVWLIAGHRDLPSEWNWEDVRSTYVHKAKVKYFDPFTKLKGVDEERNQGRKKLAEQADYDRIRRLCPEVEALELRIKNWLKNLD